MSGPVPKHTHSVHEIFGLTSGGPGGATTAADVSCSIPGEPSLTNVQLALNELFFVPLTVALAGGGTYEIGQSFATQALTWTASKTLASQSISGGGVGALSPSARSATATGPFTSDTTWTLTANATSGEAASSSASLLFRHRRRWGVSATETADAALIDALTGAEFATSRAQSRSMSPSAQYLYFAWPSSWGTPTFTVNGLPVSGWVKTTIAYTNPSGNTTNFDVYRSEFNLTGTFSVVVS